MVRFISNIKNHIEVAFVSRKHRIEKMNNIIHQENFSFDRCEYSDKLMKLKNMSDIEYLDYESKDMIKRGVDSLCAGLPVKIYGLNPNIEFPQLYNDDRVEIAKKMKHLYILKILEEMYSDLDEKITITTHSTRNDKSGIEIRIGI